MKIGFQIMKDGSINGKLVALSLTYAILAIYILGFWVAAIKEGLKDYGNQLLEYYAISVGPYWLKQIGKAMGITQTAGAIVNKINSKAMVVKEEEGDA